MPTKRALTQDEIAELDRQGYDPAKLPSEVTILTPEEQQQQQLKSQGEQQGQLGAVGATAKAHVGSYLGGAAMGLPALALLGETIAAPFTGGGTAAFIPATLGLMGVGAAGAAGSYLGQKAQDTILPAEMTQRLQQNAAAAQAAYPKTSMATDIGAGAVLQGGRPSLAVPGMALKGLSRALTTGTMSTVPAVERAAIRNVLTMNAANTGVNAGLQYATTGQVNPSELAGSALGGALFSQPNAIGRKVLKWEPLTKLQEPTPQQGRYTLADGQIERVEQYDARAKQAAKDEYDRQQMETQSANEYSQQEFERLNQEQQQQRDAAAFHARNWNTITGTDSSGEPAYAIGSKTVKSAFRNRVKEANPLPDGADDLTKAQVSSHISDAMNVPVKQMRDELYEQDFASKDPTGYQQYAADKQQKAAAQQQRIAQMQQNVLAQNARIANQNEVQKAAQMQQQAQQQAAQAEAQRQLAARQARHDAFIEAFQRDQQAQQQMKLQQIKDVAAQSLAQRSASTGTAEQIAKAQRQAAFEQAESEGAAAKERALAIEEQQKRDVGDTRYSPATSDEAPARQQVTPQLLREAAKNATTVGTLPEGEPLLMPSGQEARGASPDPKDIGQRLLLLSRMSTKDTGYHELLHGTLRDMDRSGDRYMGELASRMRRVHNGEERLAQQGGEQYQQQVEGRQNLMKRSGGVLRDVYAGLAARFGSENPGLLRRNLIAIARSGAGVETPMIQQAMAASGLGGKTQYQPNNIPISSEGKDEVFEPALGKNKQYISPSEVAGKATRLTLERQPKEVQERMQASAVKQPVYHITSKNFDRIDPEAAKEHGGLSKLGLHFASTPEQTVGILHLHHAGDERTAPYFLDLRNPFRVTDHQANSPEALMRKLRDEGIISNTEYFDAAKNLPYLEAQDKYSKYAQDALQRSGHDGLVYNNNGEGYGDSYVVFHKNQIINAISQRRAPDGTLYQPTRIEDVLEPQEGRTGKQGYYHIKDERLQASSVHIDDDTIHVLNLQVPEQGQRKGVGGEVLGRLKELSDSLGKPIELIAHPDSPAQQERLNKFYETNGFTRLDDNRKYGYFPPVSSSSGTRYQPAGHPEDESPVAKEAAFKYTQAAVDRIRSMPEKGAQLVGDAVQQTLATKGNLLGEWLNPILRYKNQLSSKDAAQLHELLYSEREQRRFLDVPSHLKQAYDAIRKSYKDSQQHQIDINEPVEERGGTMRLPEIDPYYHATTTEPKVADVFRQGTNKAEEKRLSDIFIEHQLRHIDPRITDPTKRLAVAQSRLKDVVEAMRPSVEYGSGEHGNQLHYNAARRAEGIPLPREWMRQDLWRNLEAFNRRKASDNAYYEHMESNPKVAASLGYTKDAWGNAINEPDMDRLSGNDNVRAVINMLRGEGVDKTSMGEHAVESLASALMLGPTTEAHKPVSSIAMTATYFSNPVEAAKGFISAARNLGEGWLNTSKAPTGSYKNALDTGYVMLDSKSASDFLNTHLTFAERMRGLSTAVRNTYTFAGLTERFTKSMLQGMSEYLIPSKIAAARNGDTNALSLVKHIDPSFTTSKVYTPNEQIKLASEFANLMHGTKDARTLPAFMLHDNEISSFLKLASWNIAQTNNFMRSVITPARQGNFQPLLMSTLGAALGGYVLTQLREQINAKKSGVPSFTEMLASDRGLVQPALAYQAAAMASYAGFAGIFSSVARWPFDVAFRNQPQGATFPLDEEVSSVVKIGNNVMDALLNDPTGNWMNIGAHGLIDLAKNNIQLARVGYNHLADMGMLGDERSQQKATSDKTAELRRFKQVEGLPVELQGGAGDENPYMNLEQRSFKREQDLGKAVQQLPELIHTLVSKYADKPDVMLSKLRALKSNSSYETMPSFEDTPMVFLRYLKYLRAREGDDAATARMMDYMKHKVVNEAKASVVP